MGNGNVKCPGRRVNGTRCPFWYAPSFLDPRDPRVQADAMRAKAEYETHGQDVSRMCTTCGDCSDCD